MNGPSENWSLSVKCMEPGTIFVVVVLTLKIAEKFTAHSPVQDIDGFSPGINLALAVISITSARAAGAGRITAQSINKMQIFLERRAGN